MHLDKHRPATAVIPQPDMIRASQPCINPCVEDKGECDLRVIVPREEILLDRWKQQGKPTVMKDGKEIPVTVPPNEKREPPEKPSILEALKHGAEKSKQQSGHKSEPKKSKRMEM